jgi:hypothetical protein
MVQEGVRVAHMGVVAEEAEEAVEITIPVAREE